MKRVNWVVLLCAAAAPFLVSAARADVPARAKMEVEVSGMKKELEVERDKLKILFKKKEEEKWYRLLMDRVSKRAGIRRARNVGDITCPVGLEAALGGIVPADEFVSRVVGRSLRSHYREKNRTVAGQDDVLSALLKVREDLDCARIEEYSVRSAPDEILGGRRLRVELDRARGRPVCAVDEGTGAYRMRRVPLLVRLTGGEAVEEAVEEAGHVGMEDWWGGSDMPPLLYQFELKLEEELAVSPEIALKELALMLGSPSETRRPGDIDADGDVDAMDMWKGKEVYAGCYTGPNRGPIAARCLAMDMDDDNDCDGHDWTMFRAAWTGPGPAPDAIPPGRDAYELMIVIVIIGFDSTIPPIPADFFGPGSDPFEGMIEFEADESSAGGGCMYPATLGSRGFGFVEMERKEWAELPGPTPVPVEMVRMNLVSKEPVRVTFDGGTREELYTVTWTVTDNNPGLGQIVMGDYPGGSFFDIFMTLPGRFTFTADPEFGLTPLDYPASSFFDLYGQSGPEPFRKVKEERVMGCEEEAHFYLMHRDNTELFFDGGASGYMTMRAPLQTGGCCLPGGECMMGTDDDCDAMGGEYAGDAVSCYPSPCEPLWGACCYGDPPLACTVTTHANCVLLSGTWHGGYDCRDVCPRNGVADICDTTPPCAICCMADGTCAGIGGLGLFDAWNPSNNPTSVTPEDCAAMGGMPMPGDSCDPNPCPPAQGGCCLGGGVCTVGTDDDCDSMSGEYQGDGTDCYPNQCNPGEGACCYGDPPHACAVTDENDCTITYSGTWHVGYDCRDECPLNGIPDVCDTTAPLCAICCLPGGACAYRWDLDGCLAMGGEPKPGMVCTPYMCEEPVGGCCCANGTCDNRQRDGCETDGCIYQGPGSGCGLGSCYAFETACCLLGGDCINTTYDECVTLWGGFPQGPNTNCFLPIVMCQPLKWSQPPTYSPASPNPDCFWGWDEMSHYNCCKIMADDWMCTTNKPISDIHWWGSYIGWIDPVPPLPPDAPPFFRIGIWKDVPISAAPNCCQCWMDMIPLRACDMGEFDMQYCLEVLGQGWDHCEWHPDAYCQADSLCHQAFSHPGELIREWIVPRESLNERMVGCDFHPEHPSPDTCFRYDFNIPYGEWFYQNLGGDPTIYWVSIAAWYSVGPPVAFPWGWKTREHFFNDDAVAILIPRAPIPGDSYIDGYPLVTPDGFSWDMAFVLTTPPMEACCFVDGSCEDKIREECEAIDGIPQGPGTACTIEGPCCLEDGSCVMVDPLCCDEMGGVVQDSAAACSPQPSACCLEDGSCIMVDPLCCDEQGGTPLEPAAVCAGEIQACCLQETGVCVMADPTCCDMLMGGVPQGPDTQCTVPEACCFTDASCRNLDPLCCEDLGGVPQGHWTECTWPQACCIIDDGTGAVTCIDVDPYCCDEMGGIAQGLNTACVDMVRACCLPDGSCQDVDPECCDAIGGVPSPTGEPLCLGDLNGNDVDDACEVPLQACCLPSGECTDTTYNECVALHGGFPQGPNTNCFLPIIVCQPLKWSQPPTYAISSPNQECFWGWDEMSHYNCCKIMADDFMCATLSPISDIHWWGSYVGWIDPVPPPPPDVPRFFRIGIWTDVPVSAAPNCCQCWMLSGLTACSMGEFDEPYCRDVLGIGWDFCEWHPDAYCQIDDTCRAAFSHPGELVREWIVPRESLNERWVGCDFHPSHPMPDACFRYDFSIPEAEWFYQNPSGDPTIYWVSIAAWYEGLPPGPHPWGWKTREHFFNDDAVAILDPRAPVPGSQYVSGYPLRTPDGISWDMAFVLTTPPTEACCFDDGRCDDLVPQLCLALNGFPQGPGTRCTEKEACCTFDGTCIMVDPICCDDMNGIPQGPGTYCTGMPHACCLPDGGCADVDMLCCDDIGGMPPVDEPVCLGDMNGNGIDDACEPPPPKWVQLPDVTSNGVDIQLGPDAAASRVIADDFECTQAGLITDVHLFGSWKFDMVGYLTRINLSIWSDDPAGPGGSDPSNLWSHPDIMLWNRDFLPGEFVMGPYWDVVPGEWWWDAYTNELIPGGDTQVWRVDIKIPPAEAFRQNGGPQDPLIYWLAVRVEQGMWGEFGWKTRRWPDHFNDDAVWDYGSELPRLWRELRYPEGHPYHGLELDSIDMAFVITTAGCPLANAPLAEQPSVVPKNRYITFVPDNAGTATALRVTLADMPPPFEWFEGCKLWVSAPFEVSEVAGKPDDTPPTFTAANLQTEPYCMDWGAFPLLYVFENEIVPSAVYDVQAIDCSCDFLDEANYSPPLGVSTSAWGDIVGASNQQPPNGVVDFNDISAVVDKFKNLPNAPKKSRCDVSPSTPDKIVDFGDIPSVVDGFRGLAYSYPGPDECPYDIPHLGNYGNSGCLPGSGSLRGGTTEPCAEDDVIELTPGPGNLEILHGNATYNCCQDDIRVSLSVQGNVLSLTEEEIPRGGYCDCMCCFDVQSSVVGLAPGEYLVRYCWLDYEMGPRCHEESVVIPGGPYLSLYSDSGCKGGKNSSGAPDAEYPCPEDSVELTVLGHTLHVLHRDATYNCCPDDIVVSLTIEGNTLNMEEEEILTTPCFCLCCYDVDSRVAGLSSGEYLVRYCWYDYETNGERCHEEIIVVP